MPHRIRLLGGSSHALGRVTPEKRVQLVRGDREVFGLRGRPPQQRWRWTCCSTSRSASSRSAASGHGQVGARTVRSLEAVPNVAPAQVVVFRPLYAVGGQDSATCPAARARRWAVGEAVFDTLEGSPVPRCSKSAVARHAEVLPLTHIRGRHYTLVRHRRPRRSR